MPTYAHASNDSLDYINIVFCAEDAEPKAGSLQLKMWGQALWNEIDRLRAQVEKLTQRASTLQSERAADAMLIAQLQRDLKSANDTLDHFRSNGYPERITDSTLRDQYVMAAMRVATVGSNIDDWIAECFRIADAAMSVRQWKGQS